jgi:hypothetical protein
MASSRKTDPTFALPREVAHFCYSPHAACGILPA